MLTQLAPYRQLEYQTDLTVNQIGQCLTEQVITGFSLFSNKPYYGDVTAYSFSVRKTSSKFKKESLSPRIEGVFKSHNGETAVRLHVRPHPLVIGVFGILFFPLLLLLVLGIPELFRTGDIAMIANSIVPMFFLYGIFWLIFQIQSSSAIRFWEYTLQLRAQPKEVIKH